MISKSSMVRSDQSAHDIVTYFNEDPIDLNTGQPKNHNGKSILNSPIMVEDQNTMYLIHGVD
jgi:hypothetical protein